MNIPQDGHGELQEGPDLQQESTESKMTIQKVICSLQNK